MCLTALCGGGGRRTTLSRALRGHAGAYGVVISAINKETEQKVAIKKMTPMAETRVDGVHALRETRLMRCVHAHRGWHTAH